MAYVGDANMDFDYLLLEVSQSFRNDVNDMKSATSRRAKIRRKNLHTFKYWINGSKKELDFHVKFCIQIYYSLVKFLNFKSI
jgi:hypothetical protein